MFFRPLGKQKLCSFPYPRAPTPSESAGSITFRLSELSYRA